MASMTPVFLIGGGFLVLLVVLGIVFFVNKRKSSKGKHVFALYSRDGKDIRFINAKVEVDKLNPNNKFFVFDELNCKLPIKPPSCYINGVPYRQITYNDLSEFSYIEGNTIDKDLYNKLSLKPEEKQLALNRYKENQRNFSSHISNTQMLLNVMIILLFILSLAGVIFTIVKLTAMVAEVEGVAEELSKSNRNAKEANQIMLETAEILVEVTTNLKESANIARQIS